jgi:hypothetical protein
LPRSHHAIACAHAVLGNIAGATPASLAVDGPSDAEWGL